MACQWLFPVLNQAKRRILVGFACRFESTSCHGCGIALQYDNPKALGFVPKEKTESYELEVDKFENRPGRLSS